MKEGFSVLEAFMRYATKRLLYAKALLWKPEKAPR